jgi:predicted 3-demethylubiquinone-9 3-methyltransferase (glyoxalase superfamily)
MQKIIPHLWFDSQAEEAADYYISIFSNSKKLNIDYHNKASAEVSGQPVGSVMGVEYEIEGFRLYNIKGGPYFHITPAVSLFINYRSEAEVDQLWGRLSEGGKVLIPLDKYPFSDKYGWVEDKYGMSWQLMLCSECEQKVIPSLMYVGENSGRAEEAINFYTSVFEDSKIGDISRYGAGMEPNREEDINYAAFTLSGQKFVAMDSALDHQFNFTEGLSLLVNLSSQEEIDYYWDKLSAVPEAEQCGWLKDKFGVSWQIVPEMLNKYLRDPDSEKAERVMEALLKMKKINIAELEAAYEGKRISTHTLK